MPVLGLVEAVFELGYQPIRCKKIHRPENVALQYDGRKLASKRAYLQCVLCLDALYEKGLTQLSSTATEKAYRYCLSAANLADFDWSPAAIRRRLSGAALGEANIPLLALARPEIPVEDAQPQFGLVWGQSDSSVAPSTPPAVSPLPLPDGEDEGVATPPAGAAALEALPDIEEEIAVDGESDEDWSVPLTIAGMTVSLSENNRGQQGIRIACPWHGLDCRKFRTLSLWQDEFGENAPVDYLATWAAGGEHRDQQAHVRWFPRREDVRAYLAARGV